MIGFFKKDGSDPSNKGEEEQCDGSEKEEEVEETVDELDQDSDGEDKCEGEEPREDRESCGPPIEEVGGDCCYRDEDDDVGWITPENLVEACEEMGGVLEEEVRGLSVACVTMDFAMQVITRATIYTLKY